MGASAEGLTGLAGWVGSVVDALGPVGVGGLVLLETVIPPIPSEAVLPAAGYLARLGNLSFTATVLATTAASVLGALSLYGVGRAVGTERTDLVARRLPLVRDRDLQRAWSAFDRWGWQSVLLGRLVPGVRSLVSLPAGARRMPLVRFTVLTALGSLCWNVLLLGAGYLLGAAWGATATASRYLEYAVVAVALGALLWWARARLRENRAAAQGH